MSANPGRTTYHQTNIQTQRFTPSPFTGEDFFDTFLTFLGGNSKATKINFFTFNLKTENFEKTLNLFDFF